MNFWGVIFMVLSWVMIIFLVAYSYAKVLKHK